MIVYAVNVHTGGGKVLLDELLVNQPFGPITGLFYDERYNLPKQTLGKFPLFPVKVSIVHRTQAEFSLKKFWNKTPRTPILFFGNLPPLFFKPSQSILYLQNCFLLPNVKVESHSFKKTLQLWVEKLILRFFVKNVSEVWVQSDWMISKVKELSEKIVVIKKPFLPTMPKPHTFEKVYDFITVSSFSKHKKFNLFMDALNLLDIQLKKPIRVLAILDSKNSVLSKELVYFKNINFESINSPRRDEIFNFYEKSSTAVVTSAFESFCLPVYEALHFGLKVIGPREPYLKNVSENLRFYENHTAEALAQKMLEELNA